MKVNAPSRSPVTNMEEAMKFPTQMKTFALIIALTTTVPIFAAHAYDRSGANLDFGSSVQTDNERVVMVGSTTGPAPTQMIACSTN
jgi:hypothetical protein